MEYVNGQSRYKRQLILDDGRLNIGYRVLSFRCWPQDYDEGMTFQANLSTQESGTDQLDAGNSAQIAWYLGNYYLNIVPGVIDPEHVVTTNMFLRIKQNVDYQGINYLIEMEEVFLTDDEAIITIIKNDGQDLEDI